MRLFFLHKLFLTKVFCCCIKNILHIAEVFEGRLKSILEIYDDKQKVLLQYLPEESIKPLTNHEYVQDLETLFLNDRLVCIKKSSGKIYKKGIIIKITEMKITLKTTTMNISLVKDDYYIFRYMKKNNSKKSNRKFYEELLKSLG